LEEKAKAEELLSLVLLAALVLVRVFRPGG
jgi:hypothetical protein